MLILGTGILENDSNERYTDRHGSVMLRDEVDGYHIFPNAPVGHYGRLSAKILKVRYEMSKSALEAGYAQIHTGNIIVFGEGELFTEVHGAPGNRFGNIGVTPVDGRKTHWMDPRELIRAGNQLVELQFEDIRKN